MYEVKIIVQHANLSFPVTIATFSQRTADNALAKAVSFAHQIDLGFHVTITDVENEDNRAANFGVVYERSSQS
jgi:2-polyprenyl-6-methoxyphenol hydroxylase-like FAD-dependent oxidoreductase